VSHIKEPRTPTPWEEVELPSREEAEAFFAQMLDHLWEAYVLTGDVSKLSAFVRNGGDIDRTNLRETIAERNGGDTNRPNLRETIAELILTGPPKKPHGSQDELNIAFYVAVESRRLSLKSSKSRTRRRDVTPKDQPSDLKKRIKDNAICEIIEEMGLPGRVEGETLSLDGGITKHAKGKTLFVRKFGKEWN
jgi:hypothetical protein